MNTSDKTSPDLNRRAFLKGGSFATVATLLGGVPLVAQNAAPAAATTYGSAPAFKIKCGVIGLGGWGREILGNLSRLREAEVAFLCDKNELSLTRSARSAPNARQVSDYREVLDDKSVQAVVISTPSHLHKEITLAALQAGKHVYCEAPLAHTVEDALAIAKAAKANPRSYFQSGLQGRSDPQRLFLLPFLRSNAVGTFLMTRSQWHKKTSWRATASTPERDRELNWRVRRETSPGLIGEVGIHQLDEAAWFLKGLPTAVSGFGGIVQWNDGRDVPDTIQAVLEFPRGVNMSFDATLGNSFDANYTVYYGADATVMIRDSNAWLFKEVDSPLLGWEVYARKDNFYKETGIALVANASKVSNSTASEGADATVTDTPLKFALEAFLSNANLVGTGIEDFVSLYGAGDAKALQQHLASLKFLPAATLQDGYEATVMALKANEAILKGEKIRIAKELYEIA